MISLEVIDLSFAFCKIRKKHLKCHRRGYKFCIVVSKYITLDTSKSRGDFLRNIVAIACSGFTSFFPLCHFATPLLLDSLELFYCLRSEGGKEFFFWHPWVLLYSLTPWNFHCLRSLGGKEFYSTMMYSVMARFSTEKPMPTFMMRRGSVA